MIKYNIMADIYGYFFHKNEPKEDYRPDYYRSDLGKRGNSAFNESEFAKRSEDPKREVMKNIVITSVDGKPRPHTTKYK